jgi:23S rRNA pseudouridine1911/1915/1917 synthase
MPTVKQSAEALSKKVKMSAQVVPEKNVNLIIDSEEVGDGIETRHHEVTFEQDDLRFDRVLALAVPEFSRSYLQQLIAQSFVTLNGVITTKAAKHLRAGDEIVVALQPTEQSQAYVPEDVPVTVVFEDAHLMVVNKPAGLVVHPAPGNWRGTLLNGLLLKYPDSKHLPRAGIVHRLDKDTSGLMVVAKTRLCMDALVKLISAREVAREYLAMAHGAWRSYADRNYEDTQADFEQNEDDLYALDAASTQPDRIVVQSIGRDPRNRLKMAAFDPISSHAKAARTDIFVLQQTDDYTWVQCKLHTGRTHQIRVHMAYVGHPLVSDAVYGGKPGLGLLRQALHAKRLAFTHPMTGEPLEFLAALPPDMEAALEELQTTES